MCKQKKKEGRNHHLHRRGRKWELWETMVGWEIRETDKDIFLFASFVVIFCRCCCCCYSGGKGDERQSGS